MIVEDERPPGTTDTASGTTEANEPAGDASAESAVGSEAENASETTELERLQHAQKQLLSEKSTWEQTQKRNEELERENEKLRGAGTNRPTTDPTKADVDQARRDFDDLNEDLSRFTAHANSSDPEQRTYGRAMLRQHRAAQATYHQLAFMHELGKVPAHLRDRVEQMVRQGEANTVKAAQGFAESEHELAELRKNGGKPKDTTEAKRLRLAGEPEPPSRRLVTNREVESRTITKTQYQAQLNSLMKSGDFDARQRLIADRNAGKIRLKDG